MSEECTHDCSNCGQNCSERSALEKARTNELSEVKKTIAVISGKGGVGKSLVTSMLAVSMQRRGYRTAVMDCDITGPSIPRMFGIHDKAGIDESGLYPAHSKTGIGVMSVNLLLQSDTDPVVWRGPVVAGVVKQFWTDTIWGDVDFMFVDMPPGTGDVPLTVFQSIPLDGVIIVTTPQELVSMIVEKAIKMAQLMDIPVLGIVENMSYAECPDCGKKFNLFGESHLDEVAKTYGLEVLGRIPFRPAITAAGDVGSIELCDDTPLKEAADKIEALIPEEDR